MRLRLWLLAFLLWAPVPGVLAHTSSITRIDAVLATNSLTLTFQLNQPDLLQFFVGRTNETFLTEAEIRAQAAAIAESVRSRVKFQLDEQPPTPGALSNWPPHPLVLTLEERPGEIRPAPIPLVLRWEIPATAKQLELAITLFDQLGFSALYEIVFHRGGGALPVVQLLAARQVMVIDLAVFQEEIRAGDATPAAPAAAGAPPATAEYRITAGQFLRLGFTHILPKGLDHILFVLGLYLLSARLKPLFWQVTAFTLAHSITLALAVLGVFALPGRIVEPIIALSIAVVAIENLFHDRVTAWRWAAVFGFGLIHGMGFAGVLRDVGLPSEKLGTVLLSFNVGVELGQLAVILLAFALTGWFQNRAWYDARIRRPACVLIALMGVIWTVERLWSA